MKQYKAQMVAMLAELNAMLETYDEELASFDELQNAATGLEAAIDTLDAME